MSRNAPAPTPAGAAAGHRLLEKGTPYEPSSESPFDVNGRTVFITGAARGIGAATAERLHAQGRERRARRTRARAAEELAARLGERAAVFEADVTDFDALQRAVAGTVERFGGIDVAIANAGLAFTGALATAPIEQVERTLAVNLLGVWRTDRAVIEHITARAGYLLNIASLSAVAHAPLMGPYTTTKAGVEALTDALRMETAPSGARVGCAYFGFIDTDLVRAGLRPALGGAAATQHARLPEQPRSALEGRRRDRTRASNGAPRACGRRAGWERRSPCAASLQPLTERRSAQPGSAHRGDAPGRPRLGQCPRGGPLLGVAAQALSPAAGLLRRARELPYRDRAA